MTLVTATAAAMVFFANCGVRDERVVIIKGSTTIEPIIVRAAEVFNKKEGIRVRVVGDGSHDGIKSLIGEECDIADSSTGITPDELKVARTKNIEIKEFLIGYDHLVPIVHRTNSVVNLSRGQLKEIFSGKITSWKYIGGADIPIKLVLRDSSSGTRDIWENFIAPTDDAIEASRQHSNSGVLREVAHEEGAIGYVSIAFLNADVKALKVDGRDSLLVNGTGGGYPLKRALYLYSEGKKMKSAARSFIIFMLSREGQKIVREAGFIPSISGN